MLRLLSLWSALMLPTLAAAHPHVFIETAVAVLFDDQGLATGIRVTWGYDAFTSLQFLADKGLDPDMDGVLTKDEMAKLNGFDMHWIPDYPGDSYARLDDQPLNMSRPHDWTTVYQDGKITTTQIRDFDAPVKVGDKVLILQTYDPTLYVEYDLSPEVALIGAKPEARCRVQFRPADRARATKELEAAIKALPEDVENDFPPMGKQFAAEAWVICASGS